MQLKFERDPDTRWYIDLPEFLIDHDRGELEMVMGADTLLEMLSNGQPSVTLQVSTLPIGLPNQVQLLREADDGAYYFDQTNQVEFWLCPVTLYIFKSYPQYFEYKKMGV